MSLHRQAPRQKDAQHGLLNTTNIWNSCIWTAVTSGHVLFCQYTIWTQSSINLLAVNVLFIIVLFVILRGRKEKIKRSERWNACLKDKGAFGRLNSFIKCFWLTISPIGWPLNHQMANMWSVTVTSLLRKGTINFTLVRRIVAVVISVILCSRQSYFSVEAFRSTLSLQHTFHW